MSAHKMASEQRQLRSQELVATEVLIRQSCVNNSQPFHTLRRALVLSRWFVVVDIFKG